MILFCPYSARMRSMQEWHHPNSPPPAKGGDHLTLTPFQREQQQQLQLVGTKSAVRFLENAVSELF